MLPSELYALIKARDAAKKENARKESSIATLPSTLNKEANFTMKQRGGQQWRNKQKGKFHENQPYNQKHPSREYIARLKKEFGNNYVECSYCHWPGHTFESCRKRRNKRKFNNSSGNNQRRRQPENQNHQEHYQPIFTGGNVANFTERKAFFTGRPNDPYLWSVDTSCNVYLTPFLNRICNYQRFSSADYVEGVKGEFCKVFGSEYVEWEDGNGTKHILHDVLYAPESQRSLLSVAKLMEHHKFEIEFVKTFNPRKYHLVSAKSGLKLPGYTINDLFYV